LQGVRRMTYKKLRDAAKSGWFKPYKKGGRRSTMGEKGGFGRVQQKKKGRGGKKYKRAASRGKLFPKKRSIAAKG